MTETIARLEVKNLPEVVRDVSASAGTVQKAARTALQVEGYRLMGLLKEDLRKGGAGWSTFPPLTEIARRIGKPRNRKPLSRLAVAVRYAAEQRQTGAAVQIGFLDAGGKKISKSWLRIVQAAQEGAVTPFTEEKRKALLAVGAALRKRRDPAAKYFFLRKEKTTFETPARPIIDPFFKAHETEISANVKDNFERKMRGERI